jgi:hypothetical protein
MRRRGHGDDGRRQLSTGICIEASKVGTFGAHAKGHTRFLSPRFPPNVTKISRDKGAVIRLYDPPETGYHRSWTA